jgi:hypothetical protein
MRKAGLAKGGEFSVENLAFKVLRNLGYLDKILGALRNAEDDELTLGQGEITEAADRRFYVSGFPNRQGKFRITGITLQASGAFDIELGNNGVTYTPGGQRLRFTDNQGKPMTAAQVNNVINNELTLENDMRLDEISTGEYPQARLVLNKITYMLTKIANDWKDSTTKDTSSPAGPNSATFTASHSGQLNVAKNVTIHGYAGHQEQLLVALQIGSAIDHSTITKIEAEAKAEFIALARGYGQDTNWITCQNGEDVIQFNWRAKDGSNYSTSGVRMDKVRR